MAEARLGVFAYRFSIRPRAPYDRKSIGFISVTQYLGEGQAPSMHTGQMFAEQINAWMDECLNN